ncbi:phosphotransferase [Holosporaceae bacterium 'Namur']|nr:phosphotransferase [Holosporaceae bacterium 'Namur']
MAEAFANEPALVRILYDHVSKNIPKILGSNAELNCLLLEDAGEPLRNILKENFNASPFLEALKIYADIQIKSLKHLDKITILGDNDRRLEKLPYLYRAFISQEELLESDALTTAEIKQLYKLAPKVELLCRQLLKYNIPQTIEHGDFHDNNVLVQNEFITINDWGDWIISHPFFSCVSFLGSAKRNHALKETDNIYLEAQKTYFYEWRDYGSDLKLSNALKLAQILRHVVFALNFSRVEGHLNIKCLQSYKGYIAKSLKDFIEAGS